MSYTNSKHALQILVSKKGTKVVTATNLHAALQLPVYKFNSNIEKWLKDVYLFSDSLRKPEAFKDFAQRKLTHGKGQDFYISLELAKMIALNSESKFKASIARFILSRDDQMSIHESRSGYKKDDQRRANGSVQELLPQKTNAVQLGLW